jgi:Myb/SANT-like DNA-binding domain
MSSNNSTSSTNNTVNHPTPTVNIPISNTNTNINTDNTTTDTGSEWNERTIRLLINQRKHRNGEYYGIIGRSRKNYWNSIARRINRDAGSSFTGNQCRRKFNNLVTHYYVSKLVLI